MNNRGSLTPELKQFGPSLRTAPFSHSRKQVITVPSFYNSRPNQAPDSAKRALVGNKSDRDRKDHSSNQAEAPHSPPPSYHESGR